MRHLLILVLMFHFSLSSGQSYLQEKVIINSNDWQLVGDLIIPDVSNKAPAVLLLHKANGDRSEYNELAIMLASKSIASLSLDLRGHGESTNLGKFIPGEVPPPNPMIYDAEEDVIAAIEFLKNHPKIDGSRIGGVGGSYSGEELAEAGRLTGYLKAYVELSPGSFSDESIASIDQSNVSWFFIVCRDERYLKEITKEVQEKSKAVELLILPGTHHATRILENILGTSERIALWLNQKL